MDQIHKRFTTEQVKVLLKGYYQGMLDRTAVEEVLGIGKTRFFALLRQYRHDSALSKEEIASGESMSCKLMKLTLSGGRR